MYVVGGMDWGRLSSEEVALQMPPKARHRVPQIKFMAVDGTTSGPLPRLYNHSSSNSTGCMLTPLRHSSSSSRSSLYLTQHEMPMHWGLLTAGEQPATEREQVRQPAAHYSVCACRLVESPFKQGICRHGPYWQPLPWLQGVCMIGSGGLHYWKLPKAELHSVSMPCYGSGHEWVC